MFSFHCISIIVFVLVFICQCFSVFSTTQPVPRVHWVFIHYHKTGHDLCDYFGEAIFNTTTSACHRVKRQSFHYIAVKSDERGVLDADVSIIRPYHFDWNQVFDVKGHQFRVIHFVRDPFDMVMSAFLYHKQVPYPAPEPWLGATDYNPCKYNETAMNKLFIPYLTQYTKNKADIKAMVGGVTALCNVFRRKFKAENYNKVLANAKTDHEIYEGIRYEATRSLLQSFNGDILRMAYNTLQEIEITKALPNSVIVKRMYTSEFPVVDVEVFRKSTTKMYDFLMPHSKGVFYECITKEDAISVAVEAAYKSIPTTYSANSSYFSKTSNSLGIAKANDARAHITSDQMSKSARLGYMQRLEDDLVLGPILKIVRQIIFNKEYSSDGNYK